MRVCPYCGSAVEASAESATDETVCAACTSTFQSKDEVVPAPPPPVSRLAIAAFVLWLVSLVCAVFIDTSPGEPAFFVYASAAGSAVVLGTIALFEVHAKNLRGKGWAWAALILSFLTYV